MIIRALKTWHHYLWGSPFPVQVFTDHKNLLYFKQPQKLNCRQARWLLDLADFDLWLIYMPGKELAAPDALSCHPDFNFPADTNNDAVTLLPPSLFVNLIDSELLSHLASSLEKDPVVLNALQSIGGDVPTQFRS